MVTEEFVFEGHNQASLSAIIWLPEGKIRAILQITHGMTEHMGRYEEFARDLTDCGIAVAGFDLRGHGKNPGDPSVASFGEGGWEASIEDMRLFFELLAHRFPEVPHFMHGFSLGSFLLREYLGKYQDGVEGAIILGTGHQPRWLLSMMIALVDGQIRKAGFDNTTDLIDQLSFGAYNQKFKPNRTTADWICGDDVQTDAYLADPLVRKKISAGLFRQLLGSMLRTGRIDAYENWRKDLPILLLYGELDPVGNQGKGVCALQKLMERSGLSNIVSQQLIYARHDLLHEEACGAAENTRHAIADWLLG